MGIFSYLLLTNFLVIKQVNQCQSMLLANLKSLNRFFSSLERLWIRMQNMHRTDKRKAFNPKYRWCSQRIRTLVSIGLQIFSLLCSNLFYNASFKKFIRTSTPPITRFALVRAKAVWGQPSMAMIFPKADRGWSSKFATGLNTYHNFVFYIYTFESINLWTC